MAAIAAIAAIAVIGMTAFSAVGFAAEGERVPSGKSDFVFAGWAGPPIRVWTYRPESVFGATPVVFVMHGTKRDGDRYRNEWAGLAEANRFILVVPEFPKSDFSSTPGYNLGNVYDASGRENPRQEWAFAAIEPLFDEVKRLTGSVQPGYTLYGHSAGAQFAHRYLLFMPDARVTTVIAANAGWYTMPAYDEVFPYGLGGAPVARADLDAAFGKDLIVLLGTADTDPNAKSLRRTPEALAQGPHRFARGHAFYDAAAAQAHARGMPFEWQIRYAPGVGHKNGLMAEFAVKLITAVE